MNLKWNEENADNSSVDRLELIESTFLPAPVFPWAQHKAAAAILSSQLAMHPRPPV